MAAATVWQLLFVDDDPDFCRQVQEFLDGEMGTLPPCKVPVKFLSFKPGNRTGLVPSAWH